jgi:hypothetical protein
MITTIEQFSLADILTPAQRPEDARQNAVIFGPNLTILKGTFLGKKTADQKMYAYVNGAGDGTQVPSAIAMYTFKTDANGLAYLGDSTTVSTRNGPWTTMPVWESGVFDPNELGVAALVAEVDTFTPATIEVGDIFTLTYTRPDLTTKAISFTATATTAANVSAGIIALWNADNELAGVATASGTSTVVLTGKVAGVAFSVASTTTDGGVANTQTFARVATTAASGRSMANILTDWAGSKLLPNGFIHLP